MIYPRLSIVNNVNVLSILFSSVFEIGDSHHLNLDSRAIAVQREQQIFLENEAPFELYSIFQQPPPPPPPYIKPVNMKVINETPLIHVGTINVYGVSSSSALHIGSTGWIKSDSRVKHIRQLKK